MAIAPLSTTAGTSSLVMVPKRIPMSEILTSYGVQSWVTGTAYSYGAYIKTSGNKAYMCVVAGTSTVEPSHTSGDNTESDSVAWRFIPTSTRTGTIITNDSDATVYLSMATIGACSAAVANKGVRINSSGGSIFIGPEVQGEIAVICGSSNKVVTYQEL